MKLNLSEIEPAINHFLAESEDFAGESMRVRSRKRGGLLRLPLNQGGYIIVKLWRMRNLKERIKSFANLGNGRREWNMHRMIYQGGIDVPEPLAYYRLTSGVNCEIMAIEDLGETIQGLPYLKRIISDEDESKIVSFEKKLIESTLQFIKLGILDIDHQLNNFVVNQSGRLIRIDFECAHRYSFRVRKRQEYPEMLARLLASHIYAVQPDVDRSIRFAERLYSVLNVDKKTKNLVAAIVNEKLAQQGGKKMVATKISLPV